MKLVGDAMRLGRRTTRGGVSESLREAVEALKEATDRNSAAVDALGDLRLNKAVVVVSSGR